LSALKPVVNVVQFFAAASALAFVVLLFVNDPDSPDAGTGSGGGAGGAGGQVDGAAVFSQNCAGCHGGDAGGGSGPPLNDGLVVANFPDIQDQIDVVTDGRGPMPSFGDRLSAEEIQAVVEYTRTL
jgi:mono/diheme cytochrome c family protein